MSGDVAEWVRRCWVGEALPSGWGVAEWVMLCWMRWCMVKLLGHVCRRVMGSNLGPAPRPGGLFALRLIWRKNPLYRRRTYDACPWCPVSWTRTPVRTWSGRCSHIRNIYLKFILHLYIPFPLFSALFTHLFDIILCIIIENYSSWLKEAQGGRIGLRKIRCFSVILLSLSS